MRENNKQKPTSTSPSPLGGTTEGSKSKPSREMGSLRVDLEGVARNSGVRMSIAVRDLNGTSGGQQAGVNEDLTLQSASLIKLLILYELLRQVDEGKISLEEPLGGTTVRSLAESMIEVSDNAATNLLIDRLGFDNINAEAGHLDLEQTHLGRHMLDFTARARGEDNYTSASDMVTLLTDIWKGTLLSPGSRRFALYMLEHQQRNIKIPAALPSDVRVLHKTGELPGIQHDTGIVILPDGKVFVIAVLTEGDDTADIAAIQKVAKLTYQIFSATK